MAQAQRLLLIDDDARLTAMVGDYLRGAGFEVDAAPARWRPDASAWHGEATTRCCST